MINKNLDILSLDKTNPLYFPPSIIFQTTKKFLDKNNLTSYLEPEGLLELRNAICLKLRNINHIEAAPDQIIVTAGSSLAIELVLLLGSREEGAFLCPDPGFPPYFKISKYLRKNVIFYRPNELGSIKSIVSKNKVSLCIINTPVNPTGHIFTHADLKELVALSYKYKFFILSDETYENYVYDDKHVSPAVFDSKGNIFSSFSFSKTYSMSGWRIGYLIVPIIFIQETRSLYRALEINTSIISQVAALAALTDLSFPKEIHNYYLKQRNNLINLLDSNNIPFILPQGGLSFWINIAKAKLSSEAFVEQCFKYTRIVVQSGSQFGPNGEGFIRVSFSGKNNEVLEGFKRLINFYHLLLNAK